MAMTFLEEMSDRAGRILPTPFAEIVEEATSDVLLAPDWERNCTICEYANDKSDNVVDIIRAVRRRIDHKSGKVQYFTVVLLKSLIKSCGYPVHKEIADTKGLLRDLVLIAARVPGRDGEREAKEEALKLIFNCSFWFDGHPKSAELSNLAQLANWARTAHHVKFDGVEREDFQVMVDVAGPGRPGTGGANSRRVASSRAAAARVRQQQQRNPDNYDEEAGVHAPQRQSSRRQQGIDFSQPPRFVESIPLEPPTEQQITAMMDNAMLLADCLNAAEQEHQTPAQMIQNDYLSQVAMQVRRDRQLLELIVSCGYEGNAAGPVAAPPPATNNNANDAPAAPPAEAPVDVEVYFSVVDTQSSVLERLAQMVRAPAPTTQSPPAPGTATTTTTTSTPPAVSPQATLPPQQSSPKPVVVQPQPHPSVAPPPTHQIYAQVAGQPTAANMKVSSGSAKHRSTGERVTREDMVEMEDAPQPTRTAATTAAAPSLDELFATTAATPAQPSAFPRPAQNVTRPEGDNGAMAHSDEPAAPVGGSVNGDEFDAFLDSRLAGAKKH